MKRKTRVAKLALPDPLTTRSVHEVTDEVHKLQDLVTEYEILVVTFPSAGSDVEVTHRLGRAPVGYYPIRKTAECDVYDGSNAVNRNNTRTIILRGSASSTVTLRLF